MRRRGLTEGDRALWATYARLVSPLPGVVVPEPPPPPPLPEIVSPEVAPPALRARPRAAPSALLAVGAAPGGLDTGSWTRFRTGKLAASRTLDLHGRTAQAAYTALNHFVVQSAAQGLRCVEVITGRDRGETGVIRREFPLWLNQQPLRGLVLAAAHPHPANPGSVRLLLRRHRV